MGKAPTQQSNMALKELEKKHRPAKKLPNLANGRKTFKKREGKAFLGTNYTSDGSEGEEVVSVAGVAQLAISGSLFFV